MFIIEDNRIESLTVTSANVNYPKENLLNRHLLQKYQSTSNEVTLTMDISMFNTLTIFNTNAVIGTLRVYDKDNSNAIVTERVDEIFETTGSSKASVSTIATQDGVLRNLILYNNNNVSANTMLADTVANAFVVLNLKAKIDQVLQIGLMFGGFMQQYGYVQTSNDVYEVYDNLKFSQNGTPYTKFRPARMDLSLNLLLDPYDYPKFIKLLNRKAIADDRFMVIATCSSSSLLFSFNGLKYGFFQYPESHSRNGVYNVLKTTFIQGL